MIKAYSIFIMLTFTGILSGQNGNHPTYAQQEDYPIEKIILDSLDVDYGYYLALQPKSDDIKGAMVLLPGFGQKGEAVFRDSDLHRFAYENNILTVAFSTNYRMLADTFIQTKLSQVLTDVKAKYKIGLDKFAFGGFSAGGKILLRYVQLCKQHPDKYPVDPVAVFMADAPIDVFHSWNIMQELKAAANTKVAVEEANWVEKMYREQYGTTPGETPEKFAPFNPFSLDAKSARNERFLKDVAVRAYHDVDIPWRLNNRNQSVQHSNYLVTAELINRLLLLGNSEAEFIQSYQTGYRANGSRHPHSWSIIDEKECIQWILKKLESNLFPDEHINVVPFAINKESLSGLKMKQGRNPAQPDRILYFQNIFSGTELNLQIISSENASASPENLEIDEFLYLTNGAARLSPSKKTKEITFLKDDFFLVPRGYTGKWETIGAPNFHHEISITSAKRNPSPIEPNKTIPIRMDKEKIAGLGITQMGSGKYYDMLYSGHELTITLEGESPQVKEITTPLKEQIIYLIAGTLSLWDTSGNEYTFVSGDWVIIPNGFTGSWQSKGQELFRTMKISKSKW